jgi:hypothetical protein
MATTNRHRVGRAVLVFVGAAILSACGATHAAVTTTTSTTSTTTTTLPTTTTSTTTTTLPGFSGGVVQLLSDGANGTISLNLVQSAKGITGSGYLGPGTETVYGRTATADCPNVEYASNNGCIVCSPSQGWADWASSSTTVTVTGSAVDSGSAIELTLTTPEILGSGGSVNVTLGPGESHGDYGPFDTLLWPDGTVYQMDIIGHADGENPPSFVASVDSVSESCKS